MTIEQWAIRHGVTHAALAELRQLFGHDTTPPARDDVGVSESAVQARVRVAVSRLGWRMFRNNVGAGQLSTGSFVRFGLANDSESLNKRVKSGDLIGCRPVVITAADVGRTIGQFASIECKHVGWHFTGDERETAQQHWIEIITSLGGYARFVSDERDVL